MRGALAPFLSALALSACSNDDFTVGVGDAGSDGAADALDGAVLPTPEKLAEDGAAGAGAGLGRVAVDGTHVYWIREDTTTVKRVPKTGGAAEVVKFANSVTVDDLALAEGEVFTNGFNGGPFAYPKGGGAGRSLPTGCPLGLRTFVVGKVVYYTQAECTGAAAPLRVLRSSLDGGSPQSGLTAKPGSEILGDVVADGADVFVADTGGVGRMPPDLTSYAVVPSQAGAPATALALDATRLYARRSTALAIVDRATTAKVDLVPLDLEAIPIAKNAEGRTQLAHDDAYVYVSARTGLYRIAKAAPHDKVPLYVGQGVVGVAQDATHVYFSVPELGAVLRVKKP